MSTTEETGTASAGEASPPLPPLRDALLRAFRDAKVPDSIAFPLVRDPGAAADLAVKVTEPFMAERDEAWRDTIATAINDIAIPAAVELTVTGRIAEIEAKVRADERGRCAVILRAEASRRRETAEGLIRVLDAAGARMSHVEARVLREAANLLDPLGPLQGAHAAGGTS